MSKKPHSPVRRARRPVPAAPANPQLDPRAAVEEDDPDFVRRVRAAAREAEALQHAAEAEAEAAALPASAPGTVPAGQETDAHGFDPAEYQWLPVRRRFRSDGWTPQRQQDFIAALAETGCVQRAAEDVGMTVQSCYRLRRSPGGENFAAAWDVALHHAARLLLDVAFERAFNGTDEPVFDREGRRIGRRMRQNDRLMMFLLRAYMPERFRHAHRDARAADEPLPPPPVALETTIERLAPVAPPEPHALMTPDELEDALFIADTLPPGELPRWHTGYGSAYAAPSPLSPAQEAELERLKRGEKPADPSLFGRWRG